MNWIAKSSEQLDHKLPFIPYRDSLAHLRTRIGAFLSSHSTCIGLLFLLLLSACTGYSWILTVQRMVHYYNPLPIWDYWNIVGHLERYRSFDVSVLWQQHNEHRIVFPEIIFATDMLLAHGRQILPLACSFICYFCTWLVLGWAIFSDRIVSRVVRYTAILLAGIVIGWQGSATALAVPFLLQWTLAQLAAVLALALIGSFKRTQKILYLIGTIASGTVATYSSANGLLLWPVLLIAGLLSSLGRRYILVLAIAAVANISLYFVGYHFSGSLNLINLLGHPIYLLGFISSYLSMPFALLKTAEFGVCLGFANLVLFSCLLAITARLRLLASGPSIVLFGYFAFVLLSALLTAAGRMNPQDSTFTAAKATRYLTLPLVNWGALAIALIWVSARCGWKVASSRNIALSAAVLLLLTLPKLTRRLTGDDVFFARQQWATLCIENGLFDPEIARYIHPAFPAIKPLLRQLRENHLSIFFKGYSPWLGQLVTSRLSGPFTWRSGGAVTRTLPIEGGVEVIGWADGSRSQRIVLVNEVGRIVGLGRKLPAGFPYELQSPETPSSLGWVGFVNSTFASESFYTYLIDRRTGKIIPIGVPSAIPPTTVVALTDAGPPIAGLEWQMDPSWKVNRLPPKLQLPTSPPKPFYGSGSGRDRNTGQILSSDFDAPVNGCIILPVLHGPSVTGLSVEIRDADTDDVLAVAPMQDTDIHWRFWRFSIAPSAKHLRITAEDRGQGFGQWLAIGQPSQCH